MRPSSLLKLALPAVAALVALPAARAQDGATPPAVTPDQRAARERELKAVEDAIAANDEARRRLEAEVEGLRGDRARLNQALIATAERARAAEDRIGALERRLQDFSASEGAIRRSLEARRGVVVEVLAVLQRMGRRPPPAVLARPEDILAAVRASILLGAVVPELRGEAEALAGDLAELVRLRAALAADGAGLRRELADLGREQDRLNALVAARQADLARAERSVGGERERAVELAGQAKSLKELIEGMERDAAAARQAVDEAKRAEQAQARETRERFAAAAFRDPTRLAPKIRFAEARGALPRPVSGEIARDYGAADGAGGTARGISIATRPRAVVSAPADGSVAFAGPFRSFGRLLIINAGDGYYLLLAGMDQINVEVGQFVLAGEPVATMGATSTVSAAAGAIETGGPVLYVEFRKDGGSIDPGPWWAKSQSEKVRG